MKIVDAKVIVCCPGRNFVTLKVVTEDGIHGLGDATLNGRELSVASYLSDHIVPLLIGRDARRIEDLWQYLYKGAYWRRGPVTMSATLDQCCLWARSSVSATGVLPTDRHSQQHEAENWLRRSSAWRLRYR